MSKRTTEVRGEHEASIQLNGITGVRFDEFSGTVTISYMARSLTTAEHEILNDLFPHSENEIAKLLRVEAILARIDA